MAEKKERRVKGLAWADYMRQLREDPAFRARENAAQRARRWKIGKQQKINMKAFE